MSDEYLLAIARNLRAGLQRAVDYDDEVATIYNVLLLVKREQVTRLEAENARLRAVVEAAKALRADDNNWTKELELYAALDQLRGTPVAGGGDGRGNG